MQQLKAFVRKTLPAALLLCSAVGATPAHAVISLNRIDPAIPEPAAALVFAVGLGVVAWSARGRRRR